MNAHSRSAVSQAQAVQPRIVLHIGAHKTASTHFSRSVRKSEAAVGHFSLAVPHKSAVRDLLTRRISQVRPTQPLPAEFSGTVDSLLAGQKQAYLCEENILGTTLRIFSEGRMYPRADRRLRRALHLLEGSDVELLMAVRHPASFAVSSYGEAVRYHGYQSFQDYLGDCTYGDIRWAPLIRRLMKAADGRRFVIWRFEDYARILPILQCHVADTSPADAPMFRRLRKVVRPGLSQRAVDEIRALCANSDQPLRTKDFEKLVHQFPKSAEFPAPCPWSADELAEMNAIYAEDLAQLRRMRNVQVLDVP